MDVTYSSIKGGGGGGGSEGWTTLEDGAIDVGPGKYLVNGGEPAAEILLQTPLTVGGSWKFHARLGDVRLLTNGALVGDQAAGTNLLMRKGQSVALVASSSTTLDIV